MGLGTWQAFDVPPDGPEYEVAAATLGRFLRAGGRLIDTSPMYGRAEERIGDMLAAADPPGGVFLATKVWTRGREAGRRQLEASLRYLRRTTLDLVQVHNLVDLDTHWATLQAAREAGEVRYFGITHWQASAHEDLERTLRAARPDFLQVNYSLAEPEAGERLLPLALDQGVGVLVNRPFTKGAMIDRARGKALPPEAAELGCRSAAQLFLKWVLGHPAVRFHRGAPRPLGAGGRSRRVAAPMAGAGAPFVCGPFSRTSGKRCRARNHSIVVEAPRLREVNGLTGPALFLMVWGYDRPCQTGRFGVSWHGP